MGTRQKKTTQEKFEDGPIKMFQNLPSIESCKRQTKAINDFFKQV